MLHDSQLGEAIIENTVFEETSFTDLEKKYDMSEPQIFIRVAGRILTYREYKKSRALNLR